MKNIINLPQDFHFKKKFGQNFLTDTNLLKAIVLDANIAQNDCVLEIGAGAGALTEQIAIQAKEGKVVSVEVDKTLQQFLQEKFASMPNVEFIFDDILKLSPSVIDDRFGGKPFKVLANLPYYISSPILFYLIESDLPIKSITVMLQKELVDRITAMPNNKDYGALSVILSLYGNPTKTRDVSRKLFTPEPNVDSAILHIEINKIDQDIKKIAKVVKICFAMRRKTLINNLMQGLKLNREVVTNVVLKCGFSETIRAENLTKSDFLNLTKELEEFL